MPANFEIEAPSTYESDAWSPDVYIGHPPGLRNDFAVISWESTVGPVPAKALIKYVGEPSTSGTCAVLDAPITLGDATPLEDSEDGNEKIRLGSRVRLARGDETLFLGSIIKRMDAGAQDEVILECLDDMHMLSLLTVDAAFVRDGNTGYAKWIRRLPALPNPNGMWNCIGSKVYPDDDTIYPVFSEYASREVAYEHPDETYHGKVQEGIICPWTPRRMLLYLCMLANTSFNDSVPGVKTYFWRNISGSYRISWDPETINAMFGIEQVDVTEDDIDISIVDPLDRKLPPVSLQGVSMLNSIHRILDIAGTHASILTFKTEDILGNDVEKSNLDFAPIGVTGNFDSSSLLISPLPIQRDGTADNINTAYDFRTSESIQTARDAVKVAGDVVRLETRLEYDGTASGSLQKSWTQEQEDAFIYCITGGLEERSENYTFAKIPKSQGDTEIPTGEDDGSFLDCDGEDGRPLIFPMTPEAVGIARLHYPQVFAAYVINSDALEDAGYFKGVNNEYQDTTAYPVLKSIRPAFKEQLQFLLRSPYYHISLESDFLTTKFPPCTEVYSDGVWWEAPPGSEGLSVTGDGVIWLNGLIEASQGRQWCLLDHPISNNGGEIPDPKSIHDLTLRKFRINISIPMDHRVEGYADRYAGNQVLDSQYTWDTGGLPLLTIDSPEGYQEGHQLNSYPAPSLVSLDRYAPPGSERQAAIDAAKRKLLLSGPEKTSSWKMIGLRTEYSAGQYVYWAEQIKENSITNYLVRTALGKITFDVGEQTTSIEGMVSTLGTPV